MTYLTLCLASFAVAICGNSFIEWGVHRFLMHRRMPLVGYAYRNHTLEHHAVIRADDSYHVPPGENHGAFTWVEYVLLPILAAAIYAPIHLATGLPILAPALFAALLNILAFDYLHWNYHVERDCWFQRTRLFRLLHDHHRRHHERHGTNLNVTLPLADWCLGTFR